MNDMQKIVSSLWFDKETEEAEDEEDRDRGSPESVRPSVTS